VEKKILEKAAMRMWLCVQRKKHYWDADWEVFKWNWLLGVRSFNLRDTNIMIYNDQSILMKNSAMSDNVSFEAKTTNLPVDIDETDLTLDKWLVDGRLQTKGSDKQLVEESWNYTLNGRLIFTVIKMCTPARTKKPEQLTAAYNKQCFTPYTFVVHGLQQRILIDVQNGIFQNPLYSPELQHYFKVQWWGNIVLWGNIIRRLAERERRTTATIEADFKILKTIEIPQRNLEIDDYLYRRAHTLGGSQMLMAEKLLFKEYVLILIILNVLFYITLY
jgi:hypothetical protein